MFSFLGPISTRPTSLTRTTRLSAVFLTMICSNCSGSIRRPRVLIGTWSCCPVGHRGLANLAGRHLGVLAADGQGHVGGRHVAGGELLRINPDPHAVVALAEDPDVADPGESGDLVLDSRQGIIAEVELVVPRLAVLAQCRVDRQGQEDVGRLLAGGHAGLLDDVGQERHGQADPVLDQHLGDVEVDPVPEGDGQVVRAVVGALRGHVEHVLDAVDLLLDRRGHRLGHDLGAGPGVGAIDLDRRRGDRRVHRDRQGEQRDPAGQGDDDREDRGEDRPIDEEFRDQRIKLPEVNPARRRSSHFTSTGRAPGRPALGRSRGPRGLSPWARRPRPGRESAGGRRPPRRHLP